MNHLATYYGIPNLNYDLRNLTSREMDVMKRVLLPGKNIAIDLNISESTVNSHIVNIKNKTGLQDIRQMVYFSTKKGIIN